MIQETRREFIYMMVFSYLFRKFKPKVIFSSPCVSQDYKHKAEVVHFYLCLQVGCRKLQCTWINMFTAVDLNKFLQNEEVRSWVFLSR